MRRSAVGLIDRTAHTLDVPRGVYGRLTRPSRTADETPHGSGALPVITLTCTSWRNEINEPTPRKSCPAIFNTYSLSVASGLSVAKFT